MIPSKARNFILLIIGIVVVSLVASHFDGQLLNVRSDKHSRKQNNSKFNEVVRFIDEVYVEEVGWDHTFEGAINGLLGTLDPHSVYITPQDAEINEENFEGKYQGIGIHFDVIEGYLTVISVIPGSPSEKVGLQAGDRIIKIDGESAFQITMAEVPKKLKGPSGSSVEVTISRNGLEQTFDVTITREEIPIFTLNTYFKADEQTGYIWVNRFARTTATELEDALQNLEAQGLQQLILDLRGNGGGLLKEAVRIVNKFIRGHKKVVYTQGRFSRYNEDFYTDDFKVENVRDYPLIILIDGGSASASEIVAGAIQDYDRGLIVGMNSFGKGLVQNEFLLSDQSRIRLTVSKYYTPSGRLIQKPYKNVKDYYGSEFQEDENYPVVQEDSLSNKPIFLTQGGRRVYGGGGISPDVEIKFETISKAREMTRQFLQKRLFFEIASSLVNQNPHWAADFASYDRNFMPGQEELSQLMRLAKEKDIKFSIAEFEQDREYLQNRLKAEIARNIWGMSKYYQVILEYDNQFKAALDLFPRVMELQALKAPKVEQK